MTLMLTSVVELLQSLLEVMVLLSKLAAQLVWKLEDIVRMYSHHAVACVASGTQPVELLGPVSCDLWPCTVFH